MSRRRCALCFGLQRINTEQMGQIAHVDKNPSNNSLDNLAFLCFHHHDAYDSKRSQSKGYTETELKYYREELYRALDLPPANEIFATAGRTLDEDALKYLWDEVYQLVFGGFEPEESIADQVIQMYSEDYDIEVTTPYVLRITEELLSEHKKQQALWPKVTDCDRLDDAFAELEHGGIVCRQDFADCQTCAYHRIWPEIGKETNSGRKIRGFTFFHMQDTDSAVMHGGLGLGYGSVLDDQSEDLRIANEIVASLRRYGFKVEWDGTIRTRIQVAIDWKRRR